MEKEKNNNEKVRSKECNDKKSTKSYSRHSQNNNYELDTIIGSVLESLL